MVEEPRCEVGLPHQLVVRWHPCRGVRIAHHSPAQEPQGSNEGSVRSALLLGELEERVKLLVELQCGKVGGCIVRGHPRSRHVAVGARTHQRHGLDRCQLVEIAAHDNMQTTKGLRATQGAGQAQAHAMQRSATHHADLVDDQHAGPTPLGLQLDGVSAGLRRKFPHVALLHRQMKRAVQRVTADKKGCASGRREQRNGRVVPATFARRVITIRQLRQHGHGLDEERLAGSAFARNDHAQRFAHAERTLRIAHIVFKKGACVVVGKTLLCIELQHMIP